MNLTSAARRTTPTAAPFIPPKASIIGPFRFLEELGRKHAIAVFKALDLHRGSIVALKAIVAEGLSDEQLQPFRDALRREARIAARLTHPGIVSVMGTAEDAAGNPLVVMEFVEGENLEDALEPGRLREPVSLTKRFDIAIEIAGAVEYMHRLGVLHRDLKPSNILLTEQGHPCLVDFGIAMFMDGEDHLDGVLPGTPAFVAPELLNDAPASLRSDIFSVGVLLYWMFTGKIPFPGNTVTEIMESVAHEQPPPVQQCNWALPRELDWLLGKCLAKDPLSRYADAGELAAELAELRRAYVSSLLESIPASIPGVGESIRSGLRPALPQEISIDPAGAATSAPASASSPAKAATATAGLEVVAAPRKRKDYSTAIEACRESLASAQKRFGNSHPRVADWMGRLAVLYHRVGEYAEAEDLHRRALRIRESELGGSDEKVATTLNNLALVYRDQGKIKQAQQLLERSLAIVEKVFGPEHSKTALRLSNVADLLFEQKDYTQAERFYGRLATIFKAGRMGIPRSEVLSSLNKYRALLRFTYRTEEAQRLESLIEAVSKAGPATRQSEPEASTNISAMPTQRTRLRSGRG